MAEFACLSDLHFGDVGCVLNDPAKANHLADQVADRCGGSIGTLVLNGDIWEQCIPTHDGGARQNGFYPKVYQGSQGFFGRLLDKAKVGKIVVIFGNHDLSLWHRLATSLGLKSLYTPPVGTVIRPDQSQAIAVFFSTLWPAHVPEMRVAYPNFAMDSYFPYILFHHGHLLDSFVLGWEDGVADRLLHLVGVGPAAVDRNASSMRAVTETTQPFILGLWREDSNLDRIYWNDLNRRFHYPQSCPLAGNGDQLIADTAHPTSPRDGCLPNVPWYLGIAVSDPELPTPVGSFDRSGPQPEDFTKRSCFVFGHDHLGSRTTNFVSGVPFAVRDSAGWTKEYQDHHPHTHFLVWDAPGSFVPQSYYVDLG